MPVLTSMYIFRWASDYVSLEAPKALRSSRRNAVKLAPVRFGTQPLRTTLSFDISNPLIVDQVPSQLPSYLQTVLLKLLGHGLRNEDFCWLLLCGADSASTQNGRYSFLLNTTIDWQSRMKALYLVSIRYEAKRARCVLLLVATSRHFPSLSLSLSLLLSR